MIIQTGLRTDIPAFYSQWFLNRLKAGYVLVRNPYNQSAVTKYILSPDVVDLIGFCTKNPEPMLNHMDALNGYSQYWFVSITPYGRDIEPNVPPAEKVIGSFRILSDMVGKDHTGWRYDPIIITENYTAERHIENFRSMAEALSGYTDTCVISFVDLYKKVRRNFPGIKAVPEQDKITMAKEFVKAGKEFGIKIKACAEDSGLRAYGIDCDGCMTAQVYEKILGCRLNVPKQKSGREKCACILSGDIGAYNTCLHMCRYCYANDSREAVLQNVRRHDPKSPFLIGGSLAGDVIHQAKQTSWLDLQLRLL